MNITLVRERDVSRDLDKRIMESLCLCFPDDKETFSVTRAWHNTAPLWILYSDFNYSIISHIGVVDRNIRVGDQVVRIAGIQNVFVLAAEYGFDYGFLFCIPEIEKVYERCGWIKLPDTSILLTDESGKDGVLPGKNIAMYFPLKFSTFPAGDIHLQGNDW